MSGTTSWLLEERTLTPLYDTLEFTDVEHIAVSALQSCSQW